MTTIDRQKALLLDAANALSGEITVVELGGFVSTVSFLFGVLRDERDSLPAELAEDLATLEEVYGVALDRKWVRLTDEALLLVRKAVGSIAARVENGDG